MSTFGSKAVHWITKSLLAALAYALLSPTVPAQEPSNSGAPNAEVRLPNILFILIDDLGWMDLACQGNKLVETPNIDRLALQGMRFTNAYAAAPVCSPTRAAIMTGKEAAKVAELHAKLRVWRKGVGADPMQPNPE